MCVCRCLYVCEYNLYNWRKKIGLIRAKSDLPSARIHSRTEIAYPERRQITFTIYRPPRKFLSPLNTPQQNVYFRFFNDSHSRWNSVRSDSRFLPKINLHQRSPRISGEPEMRDRRGFNFSLKTNNNNNNNNRLPNQK